MKGYKTYTDQNKIKATQIWVDLGANRKALPEALEKIKNEVGIVLPSDGKSLRNWQHKYQLSPSVYAKSLFAGYESTVTKVVKEDDKKKLEVDFDKVQAIFYSMFGKDFEHSIKMLDKVCKEKLNMDDQAITALLKEEISKMDIIKAEKLISMLIKRIRENINFSIELSEYDPTRSDSDSDFIKSLSININQTTEVNNAV